MAQTVHPIPDRNLEALDKAARAALGDRVLLTAKRPDGVKFPRLEYIVLAASTKIVYPLGGREISDHTAVWKGDDSYLFIEGAYGLTFEAAVEEYRNRGAKVESYATDTQI